MIGIYDAYVVTVGGDTSTGIDCDVVVGVNTVVGDVGDVVSADALVILQNALSSNHWVDAGLDLVHLK